jgi:molybdopterin adenylyltransferase
VTANCPWNGLARIGILVISDRASRGEYQDLGGPGINRFLERVVQSNWIAITKIVPDDIDTVTAVLNELAEVKGCDLILTTGGTGPALRDLTPEATLAVIDRELSGFGELILGAAWRRCGRLFFRGNSPARAAVA